MSYDKSKSKHECAIAGCGKTIPKSLLMCSAHWNCVPIIYQNAVYRTYRTGFAGAYLAARQAAIDFVESQTGGQS